MTRIDVGIDVYYHLLEIAHKYSVSTAEVNITLTRWALEQLVGFKCEHPRETVRTTKNHRYYCRLCYQFMTTKDRPGHSPFASTPSFDYVPLPTIVDKIKAEGNETVSFAEQNDVLVPDRGDHEAWKKMRKR